jgi:hypothetical protein
MIPRGKYALISNIARVVEGARQVFFADLSSISLRFNR